jgi:hypothetical protein
MEYERKRNSAFFDDIPRNGMIAMVLIAASLYCPIPPPAPEDPPPRGSDPPEGERPGTWGRISFSI